MKAKLLITALAGLAVGVTGCESGTSTADAPANEHQQGVSVGVISPNQGDDEVVSLEQCPAAVQATIRARLNGGSLKEIERTTDHGEVLYEVDVNTSDGVVEFDIAADGAFRGYENDGPEEEGVAEDHDEDGGGGMIDDDGENEGHADDDGEGDDDEQEIPLSEVPEAVKAAALAAVPGIVLEEASMETEDGVVLYDLEGEANGVDYEIEVTAGGEVREVEAETEDDGEDEG